MKETRKKMGENTTKYTCRNIYKDTYMTVFK